MGRGDEVDVVAVPSAVMFSSYASARREGKGTYLERHLLLFTGSHAHDRCVVQLPRSEHFTVEVRGASASGAEGHLVVDVQGKGQVTLLVRFFPEVDGSGGIAGDVDDTIVLFTGTHARPVPVICRAHDYVEDPSAFAPAATEIALPAAFAQYFDAAPELGDEPQTPRPKSTLAEQLRTARWGDGMLRVTPVSGVTDEDEGAYYAQLLTQDIRTKVKEARPGDAALAPADQSYVTPQSDAHPPPSPPGPKTGLPQASSPPPAAHNGLQQPPVAAPVAPREARPPREVSAVAVTEAAELDFYRQLLGDGERRWAPPENSSRFAHRASPNPGPGLVPSPRSDKTSTSTYVVNGITLDARGNIVHEGQVRLASIELPSRQPRPHARASCTGCPPYAAMLSAEYEPGLAKKETKWARRVQDGDAGLARARGSTRKGRRAREARTSCSAQAHLP